MYDLVEPFRFLIDFTVLKMIESRMFSWDDFYFTAEDYRLRIKPPLLDRYAELLREQFNLGVRYKGRILKWDTVIEEKVLELSRFPVGKYAGLEFSEPLHNLERTDTGKLRERIESLTSEEAKKAGIDKSTLYTLRQHMRHGQPFRLYGKVNRKLQTLLVQEPEKSGRRANAAK